MMDALFIVVAYLFGSISAAIIVSRAMGLPDPRTEGSKNPGATNVLRVGGKKAGIYTLLGDSIKGVIPVVAAHVYGVDNLLLAAVALAAFLGHLYPIFFGFKGGKGVATAAGVLIAVSWPAGLLTLVTWILTFYLSRISSLSALLAALMSPIYMWIMSQSSELTVMNVAMSVLLIWRHRSNIRNLMNGTEKPFRGSRSS